MHWQMQARVRPTGSNSSIWGPAGVHGYASQEGIECGGKAKQSISMDRPVRATVQVVEHAWLIELTK